MINKPFKPNVRRSEDGYYVALYAISKGDMIIVADPNVKILVPPKETSLEIPITKKLGGSAKNAGQRVR